MGAVEFWVVYHGGIPPSTHQSHMFSHNVVHT